jgi:hypothetical protein
LICQLPGGPTHATEKCGARRPRADCGRVLSIASVAPTGPVSRPLPPASGHSAVLACTNRPAPLVLPTYLLRARATAAQAKPGCLWTPRIGPLMPPVACGRSPPRLRRAIGAMVRQHAHMISYADAAFSLRFCDALQCTAYSCCALRTVIHSGWIEIPKSVVVMRDDRPTVVVLTPRTCCTNQATTQGSQRAAMLHVGYFADTENGQHAARFICRQGPDQSQEAFGPRAFEINRWGLCQSLPGTLQARLLGGHRRGWGRS